MPGKLDPTLFPLREGTTVPRDLVVPHTATLWRRYGVTLDTLVIRGGISVYELLMLQPAPEGTDAATHVRNICECTVRQAMSVLSPIVTEWQAKRDADAEAAMLAMMDEGVTEENAEQPTV